MTNRVFYTSNTDDKISKYKLEIEELTRELGQIKQKNKYMERKEREQAQQIRELKDQIQKLRTKTSSNETASFEAKLIISQKERTIKQLNEELKTMK